MGWLWGSSDPFKAQDPNHTPQSPSTEQSHTEPPSAAPPNRNEQAFADLKELFSQIDPERSERASAAAKKQLTVEIEDDENSIYPSEMSCSQCFDLAYYCSSVGGQLNNVYRFGGLRSCTEQWAKWRFCMRTKAMSADMRRLKIREFYQAQAAKYKVGKSSEDIWDVRREPVERPFSKSLNLYQY